MRAEVGLQALLSGEHSVADVALDAAGGLGALDDQSVDDVCSRAASPGLAAPRVRAFTRGASMATAGAAHFQFTHVFTPVPRVQRVVLHGRAAVERHAAYLTLGTPFGRRKHRIFSTLFGHAFTECSTGFTALLGDF